MPGSQNFPHLSEQDPDPLLLVLPPEPLSIPFLFVQVEQWLQLSFALGHQAFLPPELRNGEVHCQSSAGGEQYWQKLLVP